MLTFAATHPAITDHQPLTAERIADVLLHGITDLDATDLSPATTGGASC